MRKTVLFPVLCFCTAANAGIYRWVDDNGVIHYSDQPSAGAEQVELPKATVYSPPALPRQSGVTSTPTAPAATPATEAVNPYTSIAVVSPQADETLRSNDGQLNISVELKPGLQTGHKIRVYLDGNQAVGELDTTQITLTNLDRGTHSLAVSVLDENSNELMRSASIAFHLMRVSTNPKPTPRP